MIKEEWEVEKKSDAVGRSGTGGGKRGARPHAE